MSTVRVLSTARRLLVIASLTALGACSEQAPTEPIAPEAAGSFLWPSPAQPQLLQCGLAEARATSATIDALGGVISLGATKVLFPAGALPGPTNVTLTIPATPYVEITIETDGRTYFPEVLKQPIVTIDYSRCRAGDVLTKRLSAWYIDTQTKALLEKMVSIDNKLTRSVTFVAPHFSGYAIAF